MYKHNEEAIEKALVNAATAADGKDECSNKNVSIHMLLE